MKGRCRWKSEVILMTSARWGRMKTGRCLNIHPTLLAATGHDPLFIGCSSDVLSLLDRKCSGRSECDVRIPDTDLDTVTPCYPDQKSFLEASYTCVKGSWFHLYSLVRCLTVPIAANIQFLLQYYAQMQLLFDRTMKSASIRTALNISRIQTRALYPFSGCGTQ